eukprot:Gb_24963 [translate_table: standard]
METSQSKNENKLTKKQRVDKDIASSYSSIASASACNSIKKTTSSATLKSLWNPMEKFHVDGVVGDFFYANGIPFNVARSPYFHNMIQQVMDFGKGYKPPSCEALRTTILQRSKERLTNKLESIKEIWKHIGCTIISDGWSYMKHMPLINVLVYSPQGILFVKVVDVMDHTKTLEFIFKILEEAVLEVGEKNVVQIVTDSASNCVSAGKMIMARFKTIYWTPCATHCMDLLLHDLGKLPWVNEAIRRGKLIANFIVNHRITLNIYRKHAMRELLRPYDTRFSTYYITLTRVVEEKASLRLTMCSNEWEKSPLSNTSKVKLAEEIILSNNF